MRRTILIFDDETERRGGRERVNEWKSVTSV